MPPLVSIIIPHFRRPDLLAEAVQSIRRNINCAFEILIIDDGSPDEEWKAVQAMEAADLRVFQRFDGLKGPSRCRNIGLAEARGEYLIFLDSDDWMAPWCLEVRLRTIRQNESVDLVVFPVMLFKDQPGDLDVMWNSLEDGRSDLVRFASSDPPWHTSSPVWRTSALRRIGGFNEAVFYGDDSDLHLRALAEGLRVEKEVEALPDVFIRRSDTPRITNSLSTLLVASRLTRLREGSCFLMSKSDLQWLMATWEGQYFVEAEFLLFNHEPARDAVSRVLESWEIGCKPSRCRCFVVRLYFSIALASRKHAYFVLRAARRTVMNLLPATYFPSGGHFHHSRVSQSQFKILQENLS